MIGVCTEESIKKSVNSGIFVCDDMETCLNCFKYQNKHSEKSVEEDFNKVIRNPSLCGKEYPKLATLMWVLEGKVKKGIFRKIIEWFKNG